MSQASHLEIGLLRFALFSGFFVFEEKEKI